MNGRLNIGTFNTRSIQSGIRKEQLSKDLCSYQIDVLCIQETKIQNGEDINIDGNRLVCFPSDCRFYGCGFFINRKWVNNIFRTWKISDRICVLQLILNLDQPPHQKGKTNIISIINVYAPTTQRSNQHPEEKQIFYNELNNVIDELKNKSILFIAGDFNAKIGKRLEGDTCIGQFSKGTRNDNGYTLVELCEDKNLFISNSAFNHPARHQTTWTGQIKNKSTGNINTIYNQIDYIVCQKRHKHLLTNSRSYAGTQLTSDHRLVKANFKFENIRLWKRNRHSRKTPKINVSVLASSENQRTKYQHTLDTKLTNVITTDNNTECVAAKLKHIQSAIRLSGEESVGVVEPNHNKSIKHSDEEISVLSREQKLIRLKVQNTQDEKQKSKLKNERNKILHAIRRKTTQLYNEDIERKIEGISSSNSDHAMFKATKLLNQKQFENPKVEDSEGRLATNPNDILEIISSHFQNKFKDINANEITPFQGVPKPLSEPITAEEVRKSFNSLSNNKAPGEDQINAELLKYGTPLLDQTIADVFNTAFSKHEKLDINTGVLIALQKPGKKKGPPNNLRPITLLNSLRKSLSIIALNRIRPNVEKYLSKNQSGFRPNRSTTDVVWAHKWLSAKSLKEDVNIKISGIDMSAAFDTIDRSLLLDIVKSIAKEDECRIIRFLLSDTKIDTRINGSTKSYPFFSNVGTPQGDSLSPVLFTIYLENALKEIRSILPESTNQYFQKIPNEIAYADDVDFIAEDFVNIDDIQNKLQKYHLNVNKEKTEFTSLSRKEENWKKSKKVGSLIGDQEDVERRKQLSSAALNKLNTVWTKGNKIKTSTKIHLYKSLVKSILLYNCSTWALTNTEEEKINAFHRKQLRKILNIRYPIKITNKSLYNKCKEKPLSLQILEARWNVFGHILRRDQEIPANKAMQAYFTNHGKSFRGRPITTLPAVLNRDLSLIRHRPLHSCNDLNTITSLAQNRERWRKLTSRIRRAAEASQTENWNATRP